MSARLAGCRVVVSAGPTFEDIDPVRFLGNRSSGKMGFAIAAAAVARGAQVVLVAGPRHLPTPAGVTRVDVRSAAQMHAAVMAALPCDVYIGAAAVADYTPRAVSPAASSRNSPACDGLTLELVRTRDILAEVAAHARRPRLVVGFAAETDDVETLCARQAGAQAARPDRRQPRGRRGQRLRERRQHAGGVRRGRQQRTLGPGAKTRRRRTRCST